MTKQCSGLWDHTLDKMETVKVTKDSLTKRCPKCGYSEVLKRSRRSTYFVNNLALQQKKWAADDNTKELLQPMNSDGSVNDEFTEAYGYNPFDERTKIATPRLQGGLAQ